METLSDKIRYGRTCTKALTDPAQIQQIRAKDVKEFIKKLKKDLIKVDTMRFKMFHCEDCKDRAFGIIDELAGDKLI